MMLCFPRNNFFLIVVCFSFISLISYSQISITPLADVCLNTSPFLLSNASPGGGAYSGPGVTNGLFDPMSAGIGTHNIKYTIFGQTDSTTMTVNALPNTSISVDYEHCIDPKDPPVTGSKCYNYKWFDLKQGHLSTGIVNACSFDVDTYFVETSPGNTYNWIATGGTITSGQGTSTVYVTWGTPALANLKVIITNAGGCTDSSYVCVNIKTIPTSGFSANNVCLGIPTQFTNLSSGEQTWHWDFGDGTISTLENPSHTYAAGGTYTVKLTVKNICGCESTFTQQVSVNNLPGAKIICPSTICSGDTARYYTDSNCGTFNWTASGGNIVAGQNTNQILVNWGGGPVGTLSLSPSGCNPLHCNEPTVVNIPIIPLNPVITGTTVVCQMDVKTYSLPSWPGAVYSWSVIPSGAGYIATGQSTNEIVIQWVNGVLYPNAQIVVNAGSPFIGCQVSASLPIQIKPYFRINGLSTVCKGGASPLTISPTGAYNWTISGGGSLTSGQGTSAVNINWTGPPGDYTITAVPVSPGLYCNEIATRVITVKEVLPLDSIIGPTFICPGSTYQYKGWITPGIGGFFNWTVQNGVLSTSTGGVVSVTWGASGPYTLTATHNYQSCTSSPITLNVYNVLITPPTISGSQVACDGDDSTFVYKVPAITGTGVTYRWTVVPSNAGSVITGQGTPSAGVQYNTGVSTATITLTINACSGSVIVKKSVTILPAPTVSITSSNLCPDSFITISASAVFPAYRWSNGDNTQSTIITQSGKYTVVVTGNNGCIGKATKDIPLSRQPKAEITTDKPRLFCVGTPIDITLNAPIGQGYNFQWFHNGVPVGGNTSTYTASSIGTYSIIVTNPWGCTNSSSARIDTINCPNGFGGGGGPPGGNGGPGAGAGAGGAAGMAPYKGGGKISILSGGNFGELPIIAAQQICSQKVQFSDLSPPAPIEWWWNFGDPGSGTADTSTLQNPLHAYSAAGYYFVGLWVRYQPGGAWRWDTIVIEIPAIADFDFTASCPSVGTFYDLSTHSPGTSISSWFWEFGDGTNSSIQNPVHNYATGGLYSVTLTISAGSCTFKKIKSVNVPATPTADFSFPVVNCSGTPTPFTDLSSGGGAPLSAWRWTFGDGASSILQSPIRTYAPGNYNVTLKVTNANGCTSALTQTLSIGNSSSTGTITATKPISSKGIITFCEGDSVTLTSPPATTYLWSNGSTQQSVTVDESATYSVITYSTGICLSSVAPVTVTVKPNPDFNLTTSKPYLCSGSSIGINASAPSGATFRWYNSSGAIGGSSGAQSYYSTAFPDTFYVVVTLNGCKSAKGLNVIAVPSPTVSILGPDSLCDGDAAILTANVIGANGPFTYYWELGQTTAFINITSGGDYEVEVRDTNLCLSRAEIDIENEPLPDLSIFPLGCYTRCVSEIVYGPPGYASYNWIYNGGTTVGNTQDLNITQSGTYNLQVTSALGCKNTSGDLMLTIVPLPIANAGIDTIICPGDSLLLNGTGGTLYQWLPAGSLSSNTLANPKAIPGSSTNYELEVTDMYGCKDKDSVTIIVYCNFPVVTAQGDSICLGDCANISANVSPGTGTPPYTYSWSSGQSGQGPHNVCPTTSTEYIVTITDSMGFSAYDTVNVGIYPVMSLTTIATNVRCNGENNGGAIVSITSGGTQPFAYLWSPVASITDSTGKVLPPGTYSVVVTDMHGCSMNAEATITEPSVFTSTLTSIMASCEKNNGSATASGNGGTAPYYYAWSNGNATASISNLFGGVYTVTVTDENGCSDNGSVTITDTPVPTASFTADDTSGCPTLCVTFTNTAVYTAAAWDFGDGSSDTGNVVTHCYTTSGLYSVELVVTDANLCSSSLEKENYIDVYPVPIANFTANPKHSTILNPLISFINGSSGASSFAWDFGDSSKTTVENPSHAYEDTGRYETQLIVGNSFGCHDTTEQTIIIGEDVIFYVPNAFTPNGDKVNNTFAPVILGVEKFEMWIYDRWGMQIWYGTDESTGWNGKVQGKTDIVQQDVYIWMIKFTDVFNEKHRHVGHVTLIK